MILHTGMRTDIPAFYTEWFVNRLREGFVMVQNPYNPIQVTKDTISSDVVNLIVFLYEKSDSIYDLYGYAERIYLEKW